MFLRELETLVELRHPNIVAYVDHSLAEAGKPYLAMENYLLGHRLSSEEATSQ